MTEQADQVVIRKVIPADRDRVFRNWTEPDLLRRWWGPDQFTCPEATVDLRPGGTYRLVMQAPGGGPQMSVTGTYHEITPPSRLVFTWRWDTGPAASEDESVVTVDFDAFGEDTTEVTVTHDRFPFGHDSGPYATGWQETMEKLEAAVEAGPSSRSVS